MVASSASTEQKTSKSADGVHFLGTMADLGVVLVRVTSAPEKCLVYLHVLGSGQFLPFCLAKHRATVGL